MEAESMDAVFCCGSMDDQVSLCEPLEMLKNQHISLLTKLDAVYVAAGMIVGGTGTGDWTAKWVDLRKKVDMFAAELDHHSKREDDVLFPMLAKYLSRENGPLALMEQEHAEGEKCLRQFFAAADAIASPVSGEQARPVAALALQACSIYGCHFMKEQSFLFPIADRMLSAEEKELLAQKIREI
jgi:hypothetical protein